MKEQSLSPSKTRLNNSSNGSANKFLVKQDSLPARSTSLQATSKLPVISLSNQNFKIKNDMTRGYVNNVTPPSKSNANNDLDYGTNNNNQIQKNEKNEKNLNSNSNMNNSFTSSTFTHNDSLLQTLPSKDAVIKKMKKITKAVQELFKATKESEINE
jgi:hypothetical protein